MSALLAPDSSDGMQSALAEAEEFLKELLADGSVPAIQVRESAQEVGIADRTLKRAKASLRVSARHHQTGQKGHWAWELPQEGQETTKGAKVLHGPLGLLELEKQEWGEI